MMSEEEKKAIEYLVIIKNRVDFNKIGYVYFKEYLEIVLNVINKFQKENKEKDKQIDLMSEFINNQNIIMIENEITCIRNIYELIGFDKKEKDIKQYFEKLAKDKGE